MMKRNKCTCHRRCARKRRSIANMGIVSRIIFLLMSILFLSGQCVAGARPSSSTRSSRSSSISSKDDNLTNSVSSSTSKKFVQTMNQPTQLHMNSATTRTDKRRLQEDNHVNDYLHCADPTNLSIRDVTVVCNNETYLWDLGAFDPSLPPEYCISYAPLSELRIEEIVEEEMEPCYLWYQEFGSQLGQDLVQRQGQQQEQQEQEQEEQEEQLEQQEQNLTDASSMALESDPLNNSTSDILTSTESASVPTSESQEGSTNSAVADQEVLIPEASTANLEAALAQSTSSDPSPPPPQYPSVVTQDFSMLMITYFVRPAQQHFRRRKLFSFDRNRLSEVTAQHLLDELQNFLGRGSAVGLDLVMTSVQARVLTNHTIVATEAISGRVLITSERSDLDSVILRSFEADALQRYLQLINIIEDPVFQRISHIEIGPPPNFETDRLGQDFSSSYVDLFGLRVNNITVIVVGCGIIVAVLLGAVCIFCFLRRDRRQSQAKTKETLEKARTNSSELPMESFEEAQPSEVASTLDGEGPRRYAQSEATSVYSYLENNGDDPSYSIAPSFLYGNDMSLADDGSLPSMQSKTAMWSIMDGIDMDALGSPSTMAESPSMQMTSLEESDILSPSNMLVTTVKREKKPNELMIFSDDDEDSLTNSYIMGARLWNGESDRESNAPSSATKTLEISQDLGNETHDEIAVIAEIPEGEDDDPIESKENNNENSKKNINEVKDNTNNEKKYADTSVESEEANNVSSNISSDAFLSPDQAQNRKNNSRSELSTSSQQGLQKGQSSRKRVPFEKLWGRENEQMVASIKSARRNPSRNPSLLRPSTIMADTVPSAPSDEITQDGSMLLQHSNYGSVKEDEEEYMTDQSVENGRTVLGDNSNRLSLSTTETQKQGNLSNSANNLSNASNVPKHVQNNPYYDTSSTFVDENNEPTEITSPQSVSTIGSDNPYISNVASF